MKRKRWRFRKFMSARRIELNFRWCSQWCSLNKVWLWIVAQRSQTSYDLKLMTVTRTKEIVCWFQSRDTNRNDYWSDSNVRFLLSKDWFICINWLKLKLLLIMLVIQTNRCFIKNWIRDSLCIRNSDKSFIEILNDYRISLIHDLFVTFTTFETNVCETLLITSFDAYIEVCSLKFEHQDLIVVFRLWFQLQVVHSTLIWIVTTNYQVFKLQIIKFTSYIIKSSSYKLSSLQATYKVFKL